MGDQEISMDRRDLQALLRSVTPRLADARAQQDYLRAMMCTKSAADKALALQQAASALATSADDGGPAAGPALAAAEAELAALADDLCAQPPRLDLSPLQTWPTWWWPWPWPPPEWEQDGQDNPADPAAPPRRLGAAVLLACGAQLQDIADLLVTYARHEPFSAGEPGSASPAARHEPFAVHARHEPFAVHARHEPFAVHARHEPFAVTAQRLLDAGLAALGHDR
jgi:hypothetical protein